VHQLRRHAAYGHQIACRLTGSTASTLPKVGASADCVASNAILATLGSSVRVSMAVTASRYLAPIRGCYVRWQCEMPLHVGVPRDGLLRSPARAASSWRAGLRRTSLRRVPRACPRAVRGSQACTGASLRRRQMSK
jgi:hypothetical protein